MYLCSLGIAATNVVVLLVVFRLRSQDGSSHVNRHRIVADESLDLLCEMGEAPDVEDEDTTSGNVYRQVLGLRVVQMLALFILAYVGVETTIGGNACFYFATCNADGL